MARAKGGPTRARRRKRILDRAEGYYGARSRLHRIASQSVDKALQYAYADRKKRKREFRKLWIVRINAMVRELGLTYSAFMGMLAKRGVALNRKMLAKMAYEDAAWFKALVEELRSANAA
jgi:large subunit ribosomal protein L20